MTQFPYRAEAIGVDHFSGIRGFDRHVGGLREVVPQMHLLVDLAAVVIVAPLVGKIRFACAFDRDERAGPENPVFGVIP